MDAKLFRMTNNMLVCTKEFHSEDRTFWEDPMVVSVNYDEDSGNKIFYFTHLLALGKRNIVERPKEDKIILEYTPEETLEEKYNELMEKLYNEGLEQNFEETESKKQNNSKVVDFNFYKQ